MSAPATAPAGFTHAAQYRIAGVDADGLWAFVIDGNHCPCEAVRFGGAVIYQCTGFDGPHEVTEYHVVRESDGAQVDLWSQSTEEGVFVAFCAGEDVDGPYAAASAIAAVLPMRAVLGDGRRLRFDPHPAGTCWACE